jgi:Copper binding periplasmic protein CusF
MSFTRVAAAVLSAAALTALVAGPASAQTLKGTVVDRNANARTFVVASAAGRLHAVHAKRVPAVGRRVRVGARALRNGTFAARSLRLAGRTHHARLHGTVSFVDRHKHAFVVSAAGASVVVDTPASQQQMPNVGNVVDVNTTVGDQGDLEADDVNEQGEDHNGLELEGVVQSVDTTARTLTLTADDEDQLGGALTVKVPDAIDLTKFQPGNRVKLNVTLNPDGTYTISEISGDDNEQEADDPEDSQSVTPRQQGQQPGGDGQGDGDHGGSGEGSDD